MIAAIIQARMGSTRLPGKVSLPLSNTETVLSYLIKNIRRCYLVDKVIVATSTNPNDDLIEYIALNSDVDIFRGSEIDVLSRYKGAAEHFKVDTIVRVLSDNPFTMHTLVDAMLEVWLAKSKIDYCSNILEESFPLGMHVEIFSYQSLEIANKSASRQDYREHVTPYIYNNPSIFRLVCCQSRINLSDYRFTIDYQADLDFSRVLCSAIACKNIFSVEELCNVVSSIDGLIDINSHYKKPQTIGGIKEDSFQRYMMKY